MSLRTKTSLDWVLYLVDNESKRLRKLLVFTSKEAVVDFASKNNLTFVESNAYTYGGYYTGIGSKGYVVL